LQYRCVSIHAPTRGATRKFDLSLSPWEFQSTHPRGVRHKLPIYETFQIQVSIHAPTRGATSSPVMLQS